MGGGAPVSIQSMTNTPTHDVEATVAQIRRLAAAGCQIVRVAVPNLAAAKAVGKIKEAIDLPLVVDIHFDYRLALECVEAGADKVRINPGNIGGADRVKAVARACARRNIPIRIGVNGGSLEKPILAKYGGVTPQAMVDSAFGHIALLNRYDFDDICVSLKSSSVPITMGAYELMHQQADYPLHLGVTEAGTTRMGTLKSAAGIGGLLALGIGDTFRVTLTADPVEEVYAARDILKAIGLRREGPDLIACPTCGRTKIDLIPLAQAVEERLKTENSFFMCCRLKVMMRSRSISSSLCSKRYFPAGVSINRPFSRSKRVIPNPFSSSLILLEMAGWESRNISAAFVVFKCFAV